MEDGRLLLEDRPIHVWLEPGFDHGRTSAWMLEWPGASCWGPTRAGALDRVHSAVHGFAGWLAEHREGSPPAPFGELEIVEEVEAYRLDDGYEVNAVFAAEDRPVGTDELADHLRRLHHARADLLGLLGRLRAFKSAGGRLPGGGSVGRGAGVGRGGRSDGGGGSAARGRCRGLVRQPLR